MLSKTAEYALRAVVHLSRHGEDGLVRSADMAREIDVPANFLSKILHRLVRQGIVRSERGRNGGFALAVDPAELTLARVISGFESIAGVDTCILGRSECSDANPCGAHTRWAAVKAHILEFFETTTIADVADLPAPHESAGRAGPLSAPTRRPSNDPNPSV